MKSITITVLNWEKYNPRSDRTNFSWFRFENRFFHDQTVFKLSANSKLLAVFLFCEVSTSAGKPAEVNLDYVSALLNVRKTQVVKLLKELRDAGIVDFDEAFLPSSRRHSAVIPPQNDVLHNKTYKQDSTRQTVQDNTPPETAAGFSPKVLFELWNSNCDPLPKAERLSDPRKAKARAQIDKYPDEKHWLEVIAKFKASDFCREQWRPGFDDLLSEPKRLKALEGSYDNKGKSVSLFPTHVDRRAANNAALMQKVMAGEL